MIRQRMTVVSAFPSELPPALRGRESVEVRVVGTGDDPAFTEGGLVVISGSCGALVDEPPRARLVLPSTVTTEDGPVLRPDPAASERVRDVASGLGLILARGRSVEADQVVVDSGQRARLAERHQAAWVDRESATLAVAAERARRPWIVLRFVTDTPRYDLGWLRELLGRWPEREPRPAEVARRLARRPWLAPRLFALARCTTCGRRDVGRLLDAAFP